MTKSTLAGSASLHLRIGAFGVLFGTLVLAFPPVTAFALTVVTSIMLSKL